MSGAASIVVSAVGWTLLHFVWQGMLLGLATALALRALRGASPQHRYTVACSALLLCVAWPALTLTERLRQHAGGAESWRDPSSFASNVGEQVGLLAVLQANLIWVVALWAACAAVLALRMGMGLLWVSQSRHAHAGHAPWQARLSRMALEMGIARTVALRVVDNLSSPITAGWLRPVVLVPTSLLTGMPPDLLEALLAHELAHVRRFDYLVNLGQNVVETLLFYHPAVWWISGQIRVERESIADDIAAASSAERKRLALALAELEKIQFSAHHLSLAATGGELMHRIRRLVRPDTQALNWKAALPVLALVASCATVFANAGAQADPLTHTRAVADFSSCGKPAWPAEALAAGQTGTVTLSFLVSTEGVSEQADVLTSSGVPSLDEAARVGIQQCRFRPATENGRPIASRAKIQYVWTLE